MKWRNHALMAGSIAVLMGLHPAEIAYCAAGANLPDQLERIGRVQIIKHRTITHEVLVWLAPLVLFLFFPYMIAGIPEVLSVNGVGTSHNLLTIRTAVLFLPGLLHLAGDVMTPRGIQFAGKKISLNLFPTGHFFEYIVAGLFVLLAIFFKTGSADLPFRF